MFRIELNDDERWVIIFALQAELADRRGFLAKDNEFVISDEAATRVADVERRVAVLEQLLSRIDFFET